MPKLTKKRSVSASDLNDEKSPKTDGDLSSSERSTNKKRTSTKKTKKKKHASSSSSLLSVEEKNKKSDQLGLSPRGGKSSHSKKTKKKRKSSSKNKQTTSASIFQGSLDDLEWTHRVDWMQDALPTPNVVVYNDRAEVTRRYKLTANIVKPGRGRVDIMGLPKYADNDSVRVAGEGNAIILEVSVGTVKKTTNDCVRTDNETKKEIVALRQESDALRQEKAKLSLALKHLETLEAALEGYAQRTVSITLKESPQHQATPDPILQMDNVQGVFKFHEFYSAQQARFDKERCAHQEALNKLNVRQNNIQRRLNATGDCQQNEQSVRHTCVFIHADHSEDLEIALTYTVSQAHWKPFYDVRVNQEKSTLTLTYFATIKNLSGDDWTQSKLALCTADCVTPGNPPELERRTLQLEPLPPPVLSEMGFVSSSSSKSKGRKRRNRSSHSAQVNEKKEEQPEIQVDVAIVETGPTSTTFRIPNPATIHSDGKPHKVTIAIEEFDHCKLLRRIVPQRSPFGYLVAKCKNTANLPLLQGDVNVYVGDSFVANSSMDEVQVGEQFTLGLGIDAGLRIFYNTDKRQLDSTGGFLSKKTARCEVKHNVQVTNTHGYPVHVCVEHGYPKPNDASIEVQPIRPSKPTLLEKQNYNLHMKFDIAPEEKVKKVVSYRVEWPKDQYLEGYTNH